jgi:hypothetical protein
MTRVNDAILKRAGISAYRVQRLREVVEYASTKTI